MKTFFFVFFMMFIVGCDDNGPKTIKSLWVGVNSGLTLDLTKVDDKTVSISFSNGAKCQCSGSIGVDEAEGGIIYDGCLNIENENSENIDCSSQGKAGTYKLEDSVLNICWYKEDGSGSSCEDYN